MSVAETDTGIGKFTLASTGGRGGLFGREDANSLSKHYATTNNYISLTQLTHLYNINFYIQLDIFTFYSGGMERGRIAVSIRLFLGNV